jgi:hypothetical protein
MRKLIKSVMKFPYAQTGPSLRTSANARPCGTLLDSGRYILLKSRLPKTRPIGGMIISLTSEFTIAVNAAPMIIQRQGQRAFPLTANSLNSFHIQSSGESIRDHIDNSVRNDHDFTNLFTFQVCLNLR